MNAPELRFKEYKGDWEKIKFDTLFQEKNKKSGDIDKYPLYSLTVKDGIVPKSERYERSFLVKKEENFKLVESQNFVSNPMNMTIGALALYSGDKTITVSGYYNVFENVSGYKNQFLVDYLKSHKMIWLYKSIATGSLIEKQRVHYSQFKELIRFLPSIEEANQISDFFTQLERRIEKQQEKVELLKAQKKGLMQKIFSQELRFKDQNGRDYPEWETKRVNDIFNVITDYVANGSFEDIRNNVSYSEKEDFAYVIRLQDASHNWKGPFVYTNEHSYTFLKKTELFSGDIIMSNVGSVGKFFRIPNLEKPMTLGPNALLLRSNKNSNEFLFQLLNTNLLRKELIKKSTPGVQQKINKTDLKKICLDIPSIQEQNKIADFLSKPDEKIELEQQKLQNLHAQKKGFMQQMFM